MCLLIAYAAFDETRINKPVTNLTREHHDMKFVIMDKNVLTVQRYCTLNKTAFHMNHSNFAKTSDDDT